MGPLLLRPQCEHTPFRVRLFFFHVKRKAILIWFSMFLMCSFITD
jgi:hypothetical protein